MHMQHAFFASCCCFARLGSTLNFQKLPSYMHVLWGKYRTCFRSHFFLRHLHYYLFLLLAVIRRTVSTAVFCRRYSCT